jgi:hypothetical protein
MATPLRTPEQLKQLCRGTVYLAQLCDEIGIPPKIRRALKAPMINGHQLPILLQGARNVWRERKFGRISFINGLIGGSREGLELDRLDEEWLELDLKRSVEDVFPPNGNPSEQIMNAVLSTQGRGLSVGFHPTGDLCLEMWGDMLEAQMDGIELMVLGTHGGSIHEIDRAGVHQFDDTARAWRMMCMALLYPTAENRPSYVDVSWLGHGAKPDGIIDPGSPIGQMFRQWRLWVSPIVPWLMRKKSASAPAMPRELREDPTTIGLLALQFCLLRPQNILYMGSDETCSEIMHKAMRWAKDPEWNPQLFNVPHSSASVLYQQGGEELVRLRQQLSPIDGVPMPDFPAGSFSSSRESGAEGEASSYEGPREETKRIPIIINDDNTSPGFIVDKSPDPVSYEASESESAQENSEQSASEEEQSLSIDEDLMDSFSEDAISVSPKKELKSRNNLDSDWEEDSWEEEEDSGSVVLPYWQLGALCAGVFAAGMLLGMSI